MSTFMCAEEVAYYEIKQRILDGRLPPGTRLVHRVLSKELSMSPIPLVLALRMLERDGLVVNTPGLGARVRSFTKEEAINLLRIRAFQQALAARMCAEQATATDIEEIQAAHKRFQETIDSGDVAANVDADVALHKAIIHGARCADLDRVNDGISVILHSLRSSGMTLATSPKLRNIHGPLVEAIARRDPDEAERAAWRQTDESLALNLDWIDSLSERTAEETKTPQPWQTRTASHAK